MARKNDDRWTPYTQALAGTIYEYITGKYANLVFSFDKAPTGLEYKKGKAGKDIAFIEYLE